MKKLNEILAAAEVSATNIKARHWMVAGPHFYSIHLMLDDVYKTLQKGIDAVAERLRVPLSCFYTNAAPEGLQAAVVRGEAATKAARHKA